MKAKGLIAAGGEATRLEELTRVTNKHLLPVGGWPMVYYPLQLLQLAGVREVLLVTGQQHAGHFIDLLGDGRMAARGSLTTLFDLDLTYKVQVEPGGIAQVVGMAESFAGGDKLSSASATTSSSTPRPTRSAASSTVTRALPRSSSRRCPIRSASASSSTTGTAVSSTSSRRRAWSTCRYPQPPSTDAVVGLYATRRTSSTSSATSSRRPRRARDHRRQPPLRRAGRLACHRVRGWWRDAGDARRHSPRSAR